MLDDVSINALALWTNLKAGIVSLGRFLALRQRL